MRVPVCSRCEAFYAPNSCRLHPPVWTARGFAFPEVSPADFCSQFRESQALLRSEKLGETKQRLMEALPALHNGATLVLPFSRWTEFSTELSELLSSAGIPYAVQQQDENAVIKCTSTQKDSPHEPAGK